MSLSDSGSISFCSWLLCAPLMLRWISNYRKRNCLKFLQIIWASGKVLRLGWGWGEVGEGRPVLKWQAIAKVFTCQNAHTRTICDHSARRVREVLAVRLPYQGRGIQRGLHPWGSPVCPFATISTSAQLLFVHVINFAWRRKGRELSMFSPGWIWMWRDRCAYGGMGGKTLPKAASTTGVCCQIWQMLTNASKIIFEQRASKTQTSERSYAN